MLFITVPQILSIFYVISLFLPLSFSHFFINTEIGLKFRRLSFIEYYSQHVAQEFYIY